ncbi:hypothetical protein [Undibacterium sp. TS12]|uniref:hypothetical protein n=1 Tax=Undibacterium sp. TS12 TaxID=2908202 RepID=UPI001F4CAC10|nr:hypothetical protein [Undibacterium sp. TS12]MCH8622449.1 hypothetical protein [Undibacterium sp. TS12]
MALYALIICNMVGLCIYVVNGIRYEAPLWGFWLPALAFSALYGYISADEYKKMDAHALTTGQNSLKSGIFFLVLVTGILATKNWKTSALDFSDAFIWSILLSNTKDHIVHVLAIRKFASVAEQR